MIKLRTWIVALLLLPMCNSMADTLSIGKIKSSLLIPLKSQGRISCNVEADWPVGGPVVLTENLNRWCLSELGNVVNETKGGPTQHSMMSVLENRYAESAWAEAQQEEKQAAGKTVCLTLDFTLSRVYETKNIITFCIEAPRYGVSGMLADVKAYASFHKLNGQQMSWNGFVQRKYKQKFSKILTEKLYSFFGVSNYGNLKLKTTLSEGVGAENFPLPKNPPALVSSGLRLSYEPGEIAGPEMGRPTAIIPLSLVRKYLSKEAVNELK